MSGLDGDDGELDAEVLGEGTGVVDGVVGRIAGGQSDAEDAIGAEGEHGERGDQSGVDAAGQTDDRAGDAGLPGVVGDAEGESVGKLLHRVEQPARHGGALGVEDAQSGLEQRSSLDEGAVGARCEAATVEDETVVGADRGGVHDVSSPTGRSVSHELLASGLLAGGEGRCAEVEDEVRSLLDGVGDGVAVIAAGFAPQQSIVPQVLADGETDAGAVEVDHARAVGGSGLEVAALVEDVVGRQQGFGDVGEELAALDHDSGIEQQGAVGRAHGAERDSEAGWEVGHQPVQGVVGFGDEGGDAEQVAGRVAGEAELWEDGEAGAEPADRT